ncbi:LOW QUALITY PROTEIN: peptide-N(4)-(N-acetyl-beta-glucosaminyl)asparagine amidase [Alosa alosa]|uniref:LOW QUALITY PROTEIN: peptide-N(4)-(N-acetyl-beta-glucosaminyl)asparagine amidase n=1 Tax=Alosa alosa TaxID=278164 RepID=UPI002015058E|nr:LOW QUALITY PROTEIN: peptide-N(4)-(N-acetyl-beta-glucosaminyl)asparagine amidase [Alosa alosa]
MAGAGVSALCENPNEVFLDVSKILLTYADNILRNPDEDKYKSIRIGNPTFSTRLLPVRGAVECLFEMGFEEAETHLIFPETASVQQLRSVREIIAAERSQRMGAVVAPAGRAAGQMGAVVAPAGRAAGQMSVRAPAAPAAPALSQPPPPVAAASSVQSSSQQPPAASSMAFFRTLQSNFQHVLVYENAALQQKALRCIPHTQLRSRAQHRLQQAQLADTDCSLREEDLLVMELLQWFKGEFFSWVDSLACSRCGGKTQSAGSLPPSDDDLRWDASRVENHFCKACQFSTRFPRYNNPEKLLETRRGRCGEWANCFTLCCRALGLEARYVWDSTDHVWTELYSESQERWLHCDPCENACDKPLLYEVGWGKKLSYILAFSKDQVVDVTWRYSCKHAEVRSRRTQVHEAWLLHTVNALNATRQQPLSSERRQVLLERLLVELVEFISPKTPRAGDLGGRVSGSLAWRAARGETGAGPPAQDAPGFVFVPTEAEVSEKVFRLSYNAATDLYTRAGGDVISGWETAAWRRESVFRKVETDWKKVYLARIESSSSGRVSWRLDCAAAGMRIRTVTVTAHTETFESGRARCSVCSGQDSVHLPGDGEAHTFPSLAGATEMVVTVDLDGGSSWQHAQLFRQGLNEMEKSSLEIVVEMEDA